VIDSSLQPLQPTLDALDYARLDPLARLLLALDVQLGSDRAFNVVKLEPTWLEVFPTLYGPRIHQGAALLRCGLVAELRARVDREG
jgi:hypothetical protein